MNEPMTSEDFEERQERLVLDLEGFEGPIDLLLALSREQKVDLTRISILALAEQYLAFIAEARALRLEIAADYLVMAAWLAYLKSRLLLPAQEESEVEPTAEEMAEALAFQLRRLQAMQDAAVRLMARPRLGEEVFPRGAPGGLQVVSETRYDLSMFDLLRAYARQRNRGSVRQLTIEPARLHTVEAALDRLQRLLGRTPDWQTLSAFLPPELKGETIRRSGIAATLLASLEMAKDGRLKLRQDRQFGPIWLRAGDDNRGEGAGS